MEIHQRGAKKLANVRIPGGASSPGVSLAKAQRREVSMKRIELSIFGCGIWIDCMDVAESLVVENYGALAGRCTEPQLRYLITRKAVSKRLAISRNAKKPLVARDYGEFLFQLEKDLTIQLQKLRRDLYFLHGAALEFAGRVILLIAPSGGGKSTTAWGLLHHGLGYLSDELAPVRLHSMEVYPYPHAICLKKEPLPPYFLPDRALYTARSLHVPVELLPCETLNEPLPLGALFFLEKSVSAAPAIEPITKGEAAARLYANALNPLAHKGDGIDGAIQIAKKHPCFKLTIGELSRTCGIVKNMLYDLFDTKSTSIIKTSKLASI